ncbi:tyrosine-type recombinase/integrase [Pectinatus brassicae]|uniref:Integrase n=1 Tax=Pectinatus brassicae TaxID=862415 RepID=A0A840UNM7_9FIRM|nr:site-specific integrase [Pectinatus brassicae]MBB5335822.1 integrase [Pectinatus brassicae]
MPVQQRGKNSWQITINNGSDPQGRRIRITKTIRAENKTEALKYEKILAGEIAKKNYVNPQSMTLNSFYSYWKDNYLKAQKKRDKTVLSYDDLFRRIDAALGHMPIDKLQPKHILAFLDQLRTCPRLDNRPGGLSDNSIRKHYTLLHLILKKATQWQFILNNPADAVDPPKFKYRNTKKILSPKELGIFLIALRQENLKHRLWAMLCLSLGLRRGEAIALQWKHVNFTEKKLTICQTVQYIPRKGLSLKPPKTDSSNRVLSLSNELIDLLSVYKKIKHKEQITLANKWCGNPDFNENFIFTTWDGNISHPDSMNIWLRKFAKKNNLPAISPHSLRHMAATYLLHAGADITTVAGKLGHSNGTITQTVYAHLLQNAEQETVALMNNILSSSIEKANKI